MIHELLNILLPIGKYLLAAALMLVFYRLVFKDRSSYNESRFYLSSIVLVSILVSQFKVAVYTPPTRIVEVEALNTVLCSVPTTLNQTSASKADFMDFWNPTNLLLALYVLVTLILFVSLLGQYVQIYRLKKNGAIEIKEGYSIVVNPAVPTPFSFGRNIFIGSELTGDKREMIVHHESWHIKHRHFVDVLLMEILVRLFWFNPILWMVRKELRSIHEFQTDRSVLQEGYDLFHYQTIILEEVMGNHSCLANGFNQSFTKKRFIMMKNTNPFRFSTLRQVALIPFLVAVFCLLSFTKGQGQISYVQKKATVSQGDTLTISKLVSVKVPSIKTKSDSVNFTTNGTTYNLAAPEGISAEKVKKGLTDCSNQLNVACETLKKLSVFTDFTQKGKEIGALSEQLDIGLNGTKITEKSFTPEFLASIKQSDILEATVHFSELKVSVDQILKSQVPTSEKVSQFTDVISGLLQDKFFSKVMEQAIISISPKSAFTTTTTTTTTTVNRDWPEFSMLIVKTGDGEIRLTDIKGCNFSTLNYSGQARQVIDECGMVGPNDERVSKFRFEIIKTKEGLALKGITGTAWTQLSFAGPNGQCKQVVNQLGMVN